MAAEIVEHPFTYGALGMSVLGAVGWFIWAILKSQARKLENDSSLDDRVLKYTNAIQGSYSALIKTYAEENQNLRQRLDGVMNELSKSYDRIGQMHDTHHKTMTETIGKVRQEGLEANRRLNERLDAAVEAHAGCTAALQTQAAEIKVLKDLMTQQHGPVSVKMPGGGSVQVGPMQPTAAV